MFKNYIKISWRNILRNKVSSFINISGLTVAVTCVLLIVLYVQDELSFDKFFNKSERIYQVNIEGNFGGTEFLAGTTPPPAGAALASTFPEIETYTRIFYPGDEVVRYAENKSTQSFFTEKKVLGADSNFLQLFNYKMLEGNPATCLLENNSVVITTPIAKKYFGTTSVIGKTLLFGDDRQPFIVSGVLDEIPSQSTLRFDMLRPMASYAAVNRFSWSWVWLQVSTFIKLRDNVPNDVAAIQKLEAKFPPMIKQHAANAFRRIGQPMDEFEKKGGKYKLHLQPLTDIHLHSAGVGTRFITISDIKYVYVFSIVALFLIILACVNFMNLSTAQSTKRAKEVGIRKVLGSFRKDLIKQFLAEALLYSCIAAILAFALTLALLKPFNRLAEKDLSIYSLLDSNIWLYLLGLILVIGLLAGSYPAFYLTSFKPINVLKGKLFKSGGNHFVRNGLVVFQFTISTALIICTIVVFQQLKYTRSKDLGLNKENVIVIANTKRLQNKEESFRQEIASMPEIANASIASGVPTQYLFMDGYVPIPANNEQLAKDINLPSFIVDYDFIPALQLRIVKGRNFSKDFADSSFVIVNESCVKEIGWKEPIGQYLQYPGNNNQLFKVIGVVKDFNFQSFRDAVSSFALFHSSSKTYDWGNSYVIAKTKPGNISETLGKLEAKWKSFTADTPFDYSFLDEEFDALYKTDKRMGLVFNLFTILAIFVACLGLFGLAVYTAEKRTKEIGIRKVLGASVQSIVAMFSKDFLKLVVIASVIAFPLAWWYMNKWLQDFAYRINVQWWAFPLAGVIAILIAFLTISFQAIKAAVSNPVKNLRTE
ncbi:MAG: ABC transporter permease [Chitinophagaceae bacterium]